MAHLHPESLDHLDDRFSAEKTVFKNLEKLDDSYHVFHSLTWAGERDGECDFVIFHELRGYIALEVKGGRVAFDGTSWTSTDAAGVVHAIRDPTRQARDSMQAIRKTWEDRYGATVPGVYTWAVCFLDGSWDRALRTLDLDEGKVLDARGLEDVRGWTGRVFDSCEARYGRRLLSREESRRFVELFGRKVNVPLSLSRAVVMQEEALRLADRVQDYLLDVFDDKPRVAFQGAAGTGKTWLAMKKARRLASKGKRTLVLCFNRQVNSFMAGGLEDVPGVTVMTYHAFADGVLREFLESHLQEEGCRSCFFNCVSEIAGSVLGQADAAPAKGKRRSGEKGTGETLSGALFVLGSLPKETSCLGAFDEHGRNLPEAVREVMRWLVPDGASDFFGDRMPLAFMAALEADGELRNRHHYDALIIDEGQDFHRNWCDSLAYLFRKFEERTCYIFYDDNQTIFAPKEELPVTGLIATAGLEDHVFRLRDNLRNTARIHDYAVNSTGKGSTARSLDIPGIAPEEVSFKDESKARAYVAGILENLIEHHGIDRSRVVVLSNRNLEFSIFTGEKKAGSFSLVATGEGTRAGSLRFRTIQQFKGLEADVVILLVHNRPEDADDRYRSPELLYVGYTRARHLLYVVNVG